MTRRHFVPVHDRGRVLVDVAVMLADGGEAIADIDVLRHQSQVLGKVASPPTVWRALDEVTPARLKKIAAARARVGRHVWAQLPGGVRASKVAGTDLGDVVTLDIDATIVIAHSEKENASATFKRTFATTRSACGATTRVSSSPPSSAPGTPGRTPRPGSPLTLLIGHVAPLISSLLGIARRIALPYPNNEYSRGNTKVDAIETI